MYIDFSNETVVFVDINQELMDLFINDINYDILYEQNTFNELLYRNVFSLYDVNDHQYTIEMFFDPDIIPYDTVLRDGETAGYVLKIINYNNDSICNIILDGVLETIWTAEEIYDELYNLLLDYIDNNTIDLESFENKIQECLPQDMTILALTSLSGSIILNNELMNSLYEEMSKDLPPGWDLIQAHYNLESRTFSTGTNYHYEVQDFLYEIELRDFWNRSNNIWIWACNAGIAPNANEQPIAQIMANITNVIVSAPLGYIFVFKEYQDKSKENYRPNYLITDLTGTKYEKNNDFKNMCWIRRFFFIRYIYKHSFEPNKDGWEMFYPEN